MLRMRSLSQKNSHYIIICTHFVILYIYIILNNDYNQGGGGGVRAGEGQG